MAKTGGDILVETLISWGVDTIFGIPGDGINGVFESLRERQDKIRFVQVRHEEAGAFAACAYAKFTGKLGVCLATSGPGGVHLLNGIYDAKLDGQPVLAITGAQHHDLLSTLTQQDIELDKLFMDATAYSARVMGPAHVEDVIELACRTALAYRQPTHVMIPVDIQSMPVDKAHRSERNIPHHVSNLMARGGQLPDPAMLQQADRFGTSIANALRIHADTLRQARQHAAEELAAKASVKMSFPLVLFIFPATFIVLAGPTVIGLMNAGML